MGKISSYEQIIINILRKEKIRFEREKQFKDLRNGLYRFDFFLPKEKILIEVDGEQHFSSNIKFYKKREDFLKAQERDRRKNSYALANSINLYRIPYWEIVNIKQFSDIIQEKFLVRTKWHNDKILLQKSKENK